MARVLLTDSQWVDLATKTTLDDGTTYWLQANASPDMTPTEIYLSLSEPADLKDGIIGHDFKFKYTGSSVYVRSKTGSTSLKVEEIA